jgi:Penicillin binding protein transpeptidase domain/NTF2-like N-terminal transpeptidase domain
MWTRRAPVLISLALLVVLLVAGSCVAVGFGTAPRPPGEATPQAAAERYFSAWQGAQFETMRGLVREPPPDFVAQHLTFSKGLHVDSIELDPGEVVAQGRDRARADYTVSRDLGGVGTWRFQNAITLGRARGRWEVLWSPAALYPTLTAGGRLSLTQLPAASTTPVARDGKALPDDSTLQSYLAKLADRFGSDDGDDPQPGWAVDLQNPGRPVQRLKIFESGSHTAPLRTTLDRTLQAAADRALQAAPAPAAIVAIRPSTGEILAVADRLSDPLGAFLGEYPPGSTFKVITAAGLLDGGMSSHTTVDCPAVAVAGQRTVHNDDGMNLGKVPLLTAFDQSCNTSFATLGVAHLGGDRLPAVAASFGFGLPLDPGIGAEAGSIPAPADVNELAEDSFGQGRVTASPLNMALVAAAVADGTWRSPRLVAAHGLEHRRTITLPAGTVAALRPMMRAVVTQGTAAKAGLPAGVAGKTGSAEDPNFHNSDAWFIGYDGDLAFAVLVEGGGIGGQVAAPIAARFLAHR